LAPDPAAGVSVELERKSNSLFKAFTKASQDLQYDAVPYELLLAAHGYDRHGVLAVLEGETVVTQSSWSVFVSSAVQQMGETRFRYLIHHLRRNLHNHCQTAPVQPVAVSSGVDGACTTLVVDLELDLEDTDWQKRQQRATAKHENEV